MTKFFVSAVLLITSLTAAAAETSLRDEAIKENQALDAKAYKKTIQASEAQSANVSSFLKLQDPTPELRNRPWLWSFAFKLQSLQPQGIGKMTGMDFDLDNYGTSIMPSMEFGFLVDTIERDSVSWATGLGVYGGYMSQKTNLITPNGYQYQDTRLTTTLVSAVWNNRIKPGFAPKMNFLLNPEYGFVSYTQTSTESSLANFSQQNNFWGIGAGAEYFFNNKWAVVAQYVYRDANASNEETSNVQKNNLEIGTQVTW